MISAHPIRGRARCRHDGCSDSRAPGERRRADSPARHDRRHRARGVEARRVSQAGSVLHPGRRGAHHHRRLRRGHGPPRRRRLDSSRRWSSASTPNRRSSSRSSGCGGQGPSCPPTPRAFRSPRLAEGRSDEFRRHWLGTHFFNPPRYLRLVEVIPTAETDTAVLAACFRLRRSRSRQGRRRREGHTQFHRESHCPVWCCSDAARARVRRLLNRGD